LTNNIENLESYLSFSWPTQLALICVDPSHWRLVLY